MPDPSAEDIARDPEWLPHTYDLSGGNLTFVNVPPDARSQLMFLSDEHYAGNFRKVALPADTIAAQLGAAHRAPIHFLFHTSYCCSTLLARALDIPGVSEALREPDILINLGNRIIRSDDRSNRQRLELVLRLLERPAAPGEVVIVKPSNFANRLADPILAQRPETRAVLLYSDLGTYLRSLLRRGMFGRIFGRKLFSQMSGWSPLEFGYSASQLFEQTDLQIAALGWLMQIHHFDAIARAFGPKRVMLLDSASLLADPEGSLSRVAALFGLNLDEERISGIVAGPAFSKHSKFAERDYGAQARERDHEAVIDAHSEELGMVVTWLEAVATELGVPLSPGG